MPALVLARQRSGRIERKRIVPDQVDSLVLEERTVISERHMSIPCCIAHAQIDFIGRIVERPGQEACLRERRPAEDIVTFALLSPIVGKKLEAAGWQITRAKLEDLTITLDILSAERRGERRHPRRR